MSILDDRCQCRLAESARIEQLERELAKEKAARERQKRSLLNATKEECDMPATPDTPHTLQEQLMAKVERLLQERRKQQIQVETERRAVNQKLASDAEWRDVDFALGND